MKYLRSVILCGICAFALASCASWLDVNVDPDNPTSESAEYQTRLPFIEFYTNHAQQIAAWRASMSMGDWTRYYGGSTYWNMSIWYPTSSICTTAYQWWVLGGGCNIPDMYDKAMEAGAYHYAGVGRIIWAYGWMLMADLYGEMPFTEAMGEDETPAYDTGKTIYLGCLEALDEGLELLAQTQDASAHALSEGDYWNSGSVDKWIKLGNLLKARWINKLNKKESGSYLDGKYDVNTILDALSKGPQSNADNTEIYHTDDNGTTHDVLGWDEPVDYSPLYSVCGMNGGYMVTNTLYQNLTNFGGYGVEDPRADRIIPWAYSPNIPADTAAKYDYKYVDGWRRSLGVEMIDPDTSPYRLSGPLRASFVNYTNGSTVEQGDSTNKRVYTQDWYIDDERPERWGDTVYVECTSESKGYGSSSDLFYRRLGTSVNKQGDLSRESGSFYSRVSSPSYVGTYSEACFIKAEVYFNQGNTSGAYDEYKKGIKASMDMMNEQIARWVAADANLATCPSFVVMSDTEIDNFLNNGIGTEADLTLGKILTQKRIALMFSVEIWNDMRRYDYDTSLFLNWDIPYGHSQDASALRAIPVGKDFRRWQQCSHEINYNSTNLQEIGYQVPGADMSLELWNNAEDVWTIHVWWDSDQE